MDKTSVTLFGVGDVGPIFEPMSVYSTLAKPVLDTADIRFAQVERVYSEKGEQVPGGASHSRAKPSMVSVLSDCGFNVVSVASNHAMDWGPTALLDSIELLRKKGIQTIGGGRTLEEARRPAIMERNGVRIAMLGYCWVLREGYAAGPGKPGIAPMRAHTYYEPFDYQTGVPPRVVTIPYEEDLDALTTDIAAAKKSNDVVILSVHWGIHYIQRLIADYQRTIAKAALAAGADLILGHHAHVPKAIEVQASKVCFYSLSNFIMCRPEKSAEQGRVFAKRYGTTLDPDYPRLPYGRDAKRSMIAKAVISRTGVQKVSFLPVLIDTKLRPEVLRATDARFKEAVNYMEWVSEEFAHKFVVEGDEVVVS